MVNFEGQPSWNTRIRVPYLNKTYTSPGEEVMDFLFTDDAGDEGDDMDNHLDNPLVPNFLKWRPKAHKNVAKTSESPFRAPPWLH